MDGIGLDGWLSYTAVTPRASLKNQRCAGQGEGENLRGEAKYRVNQLIYLDGRDARTR